jgi:hypothetical protein
MEPKKIDQQAAQGDILIRRITALPKGAKRAEPTGGRHIVAHSETGHHHYLDAVGVERWTDPSNPLVCYLRMEGGPVDGGAVLTHARPYDTHAPLLLGEGWWEIRRQVEMTPEGWREVMD